MEAGNLACWGGIFILAVLLWIRYYLTSIIKVTVVRPVKNGKVTDPLLSLKPRWKVIKEDNGWAIGLFIGLIIGISLAILVH